MDVEDLDHESWERIAYHLKQGYKVDDARIGAFLRASDEPMPPEVRAHVADILEGKRRAGAPKKQPFERVKDRLFGQRGQALLYCMKYFRIVSQRRGTRRGVKKEAIEKAAKRFNLDQRAVENDYARRKRFFGR